MRARRHLTLPFTTGTGTIGSRNHRASGRGEVKKERLTINKILPKNIQTNKQTQQTSNKKHNNNKVEWGDWDNDRDSVSGDSNENRKSIITRNNSNNDMHKDTKVG